MFTSYTFFIIIIIVVILGLALSFKFSDLTMMLGITSYAAKKIVDVLFAAWSVWSVVGVVLTILGLEELQLVF